MKEFKYDPSTGRYAEPFENFESELLENNIEEQLPIPETPSLTPINKLLNNSSWTEKVYEEEDAPF